MKYGKSKSYGSKPKSSKTINHGAVKTKGGSKTTNLAKEGSDNYAGRYGNSMKTTGYMS